MRSLLERLLLPSLWTDRARRWHERWGGVDFSGIVQPEEVGLDPLKAVCHANSGTKWLRRVLRDQPIAAGDRILDVGCGKGGAMKVMLEFPFSRVDGIEIAEAIAAVARANFATLRTPTDRYRIVTADAAGFTALDDYNYVYFYNPFTCDVMASFMAHLNASLRRRPRVLTIIYDNPVCHEVITAGPYYRLPGDYRDEWNNPIYVYSARAYQ